MIIEYDINCFERTLQITFPDGYEHLKEKILDMLEEYYNYWHDAENIKDPEERAYVMDVCLEDYMMDRLSETYNMWEWWDTDYYGDDEDEMYETVPVPNPDSLAKRPIMQVGRTYNNTRKNMWVCDHCLMAIESREGNQATLRHYVDEQDNVESKCDWCNDVGFDTLYELV